MEKGSFSARPIAAWHPVGGCAGSGSGDGAVGAISASTSPGLSPFPFLLAIDGLSAYFLLLICVVGAPVVLFSSLLR